MRVRWGRLSLPFVAGSCLFLAAACGGGDSGTTGDPAGGAGGSATGGSAGTGTGGTGVGGTGGTGVGGTGGTGVGGTGGTGVGGTGGTGVGGTGTGGDGGTAGSGGDGGTVGDASVDDGGDAETGGTGGTADASDDGDDGGCVPTTETCDGLDNDCNGIVDDNGAALCDDGYFCNGEEVCDGLQGCIPGSAPTCDDSVNCTVDTCDSTTDACAHEASNALCDNGAFCDGTEACDATSGCVTGTAPSCDDGLSCTQDSCDTQANACAHATDDTQCNDGVVCNGAEVCVLVGGAVGTGCLAGTALQCDDGVPCTDDACSEAALGCTHVPQDAACDDSVYCNGAETCSAQFGCLPGQKVNCNDNRTCTTDACDEAGQTCSHTPVDSVCNDGLICNGQESCSDAGPTPTGCVGGAPFPCASDGIACTVDACSESAQACLHTADNSLCPQGESCVIQQSGCTTGSPCGTASECQDADLCNGAEVCDAGICKPGTAVSCDDSKGCTIDSCDPGTGACSHTNNNAFCSDGLYCNGAEVCDPVGGAAGTGCRAGAAPACDDGIPCTVDSCNETDGCVYAPNDALCDDGLFCDGIDVCDALLGCKVTVKPNCDDQVSCTDDFCDSQTDACAHVRNDTHCADGLVCNGAEVCDPQNGAPVTGCKTGSPLNCDDQLPCTTDSCSEASAGCTHAPQDTACNDGLFCNGVELCDANAGCQSGTPPNCTDNRSCTQDTCSEASKACEHAPVDSACNDGLFCNGQETCSVTGPTPTGCVSGTAIPCAPDTINCTVDACSEATQACAHTPDSSLCGSGQFCVVQQGGCTTGTPCNDSAQCQDGDLCNGVEVCATGICQPGAAVDCNDYIPCTADACTPATGACSHSPTDSMCDNGLACDGEATCQPGVGCMASTPPVDCDDGIECTYDACAEPAGTCSHTPVNSLCSDGKLCNGYEVCDALLGCQAGVPYTCPDDGVACTTQVCDAVLNACKPLPDSTLCPCGQTCDPTLGCGSFCTVRTCQGKVYACGDCQDNDGDCRIDSGDDQCLGPCDNTEDSYYGGISGQNNSPCKSDCYFDQDTGSGNDECYWSHKCDPLEVAPDYPPEGSKCEYDPSTNIPGYAGTCTTAEANQSSVCLGYCGPLTPNGCDCFGCCEIPGAPTTVWLGSENPPGTGSCNIATVADPSECKPCTQVSSCLNTCDHCELCIGKTDLPPDCVSQTCPPGVTPCGLPGQLGCADGTSCITGCCYPNPQ